MDDKTEFRRLLTSRREALESIAETSRDAASTVELDQTRVGRLSRMDALQGQAMAQESERRRMLELRRIEAAFERIEAGDYGYCLRCEEPIKEDRLRADPAATRCIVCADK